MGIVSMIPRIIQRGRQGIATVKRMTSNERAAPSSPAARLDEHGSLETNDNSEKPNNGQEGRQ
jgi:hypothetical protein